MPTLKRILCDEPPAAEDEQTLENNDDNAAAAVAVVSIVSRDFGTENTVKSTIPEFDEESDVKTLKKAKDRNNMTVNSIKMNTNSRSKKHEKVKDTKAPKHAKSAYNYYQAETHPQIKVDFPGISFADLNKMLGERWGNLMPDQKKKYQEMAAIDRERYNVEKEIYHANIIKAAANGGIRGERNGNVQYATKRDPVKTKVEKVSTRAPVMEDISSFAAGRMNDQYNNDIQPGRSEAPRGSCVSAPLEMLPLNLERLFYRSAPKSNITEGRSKKSEGTAKESWRMSSGAILKDLEVLKSTTSKSLLRAGEVDSKNTSEFHTTDSASNSENDEIWTSGLSSSRKKIKRHVECHESPHVTAEAACTVATAGRAAKLSIGCADMKASSKISILYFETEKTTSKDVECDVHQDEDDNMLDACDHNFDAESSDGMVVSIKASNQIKLDNSVSSTVNLSPLESSKEAEKSSKHSHCRGSSSLGCEERDRENLSHLGANTNSLKMVYRSPMASKPILKSPLESGHADGKEMMNIMTHRESGHTKQTVLILMPLTPIECRLSLKSKNLRWANEYVVPDGKDVFTRKIIELCYGEPLKIFQLARNEYTGIKSVLISRSLCEVSLSCTYGEPVASVQVHKPPFQHAVHLDGQKVNSSDRFALNNGTVLSLYGPLGYAYEA
ncbi:hypothetical protein ACHAW6_013535 [Cyclotella cf. meneghiniana]